MDSPGFFAEHQTPLPAPTCGLTVCVQGLVGAHADFFRHGPATMLQVGLNTPLRVQDLPRLPRRLAIIVDASGSMQGRNMDMVVAGLRLLSAELQPEDQWALVTFGDGVGRPGGWRLFVAADLEEELSTLDGDQGATNVEAGLTRARELMLGEGGGADAHHEHRVIFLSDGMANRGTTDRAALVALAEPMFQAGVGLTAVGVGAQFDPHLLARLAEAAGGTYYFADDPRALAEIFVEEVRAFMAPVAYAIQLHVEAGGFYELRAAHGANQFTVAGDRRTGDLSMRAATLAHRQGHDDQQQGRRGGGSALLLEMVAAPTPQAHAATTAEELRRPEVLARATVTFTPPGAPSLLTDSVVVRYPPGPGVMVEGGTWSSAAAEKNFVILNIYKGFTVATAHHWGGRPGQALADLDAVLRDAEAWNLGRQDMDIEDDLRLMRLLRDNVARATQEGPAGQPSDPWRD
jgi:Ca-activated chloride channel family protein